MLVAALISTTVWEFDNPLVLIEAWYGACCRSALDLHYYFASAQLVVNVVCSAHVAFVRSFYF